jgi:hypothetical protein
MRIRNPRADPRSLVEKVVIQLSSISPNLGRFPLRMNSASGRDVVGIQGLMRMMLENDRWLWTI